MAIGDSHGNSRFVHAAIERAARLRDKVDRDVFIVSVGDFGFWPGLRGESFVGGVDELARRHGLAFWAIDGNHDYPGDGRSSRAGYRAWSEGSPSPDQPGLVHVPRGTVVRVPIDTVAGVTIGPCGGAASPDQEQRQPGTSWWPEEMITDREVDLIEGSERTVDLMIAHGHFHHSYRATAPGTGGTTIQVIGIDDENIDTPIETIDLTAFANTANPPERRAATGATDTSCQREVSEFGEVSPGEVCALRWSDIDLERQTVRIERSVSATKEHGVFIKTTKTDRVRLVALTDQATRSLISHRLRVEQSAGETQTVHRADLVFPSDSNPALP